MMDEYFGDQQNPFCREEAEKNVLNICQFCSTTIDKCYIEQHDKYR